MFLKQAHIINFRSLQDITVPFSKRTVLIGENNVGKSALLEAVRFALTRQTRRSAPFDEFDYYAEEENSNPRASEGIAIELVFEEQSPGEWPQDLINSLGDIAQPNPTSTGEDVLYSVIYEVTSKYDDQIKDYVYNIQFLNADRQVLPLKLQTQTHITNFLLQVPIFYLSALRDVDQAFSVRSPFWGRFIRTLDIPEDEVAHIAGELSRLNQRIMDSSTALVDLKDSLKNIGSIVALGRSSAVEIQALPSQTWDLFTRSQVVLRGAENEIGLPLRRHGQGTQSLAVLFLFQGYMDILLKATYTKNSEPILALEEPEAHLHPQAVRALSQQIASIECQQIITTHSPYFFQFADPRDIRVLRKHNGRTTVHFVTTEIQMEFPMHPKLSSFLRAKGDKFSYSEFTSRLTARKPLNEYEFKALKGMLAGASEEPLEKFVDISQALMTEEDLQDIRSYIQKTRGEVLFARSWMLVEGQTESIVVPYFVEKLGLSLDSAGISLIEYRNNGSAGAFVKLADALKFPWVLLSDNDGQGRNTWSEIRKLGYGDADKDVIYFELNEVDFEMYLIRNGFDNVYRVILGLGAEVTAEQLADIVRGDKVGNAYKLVSALRGQDFEVPKLLRNLIEASVNQAHGEQ